VILLLRTVASQAILVGYRSTIERIENRSNYLTGNRMITALARGEAAVFSPKPPDEVELEAG
jgi:hypothetical protein